MIRSTLAVATFLTLFLPAALGQTTVVAANDDTVQREAELMEPAAKYFMRAFERTGELRQEDVDLAMIAMMEQAGQFPRGTADQVATFREEAAAQPMAPPPTRLLRDIHLICDVDGDDVRDLAVNQLNMATGQTAVYVYSGADGSNIWFRPGQFYLQMNYIRPYLRIFNEPGWPHPWAPENFEPSLDVNDDGVCDLVLWSATASRLGVNPFVFQTLFTFSAVNGSYGFGTGPGFWNLQERAVTVFTCTPECILGMGPICENVTGVNFVTGFDLVFTPNGARFVIKTTDVEISRCNPFCGPGIFADWHINEHIKYFDAKNRALLWQRDLNFTRDEDATLKSSQANGRNKENLANITYITGLAQLGGNDEYEVVLHQFQFSTPRTCNITNPVDQRAIFWIGNKMTMLALRGERGPTGGTDLWRTLIFDTGSYTVNPQGEEPFETLIFVFGQILPDLNGDGTPEVFANHLMQERNSPTSTNGAFRTHFVPLDGKTGKRLLPTVDLKLQGYGYAASMAADPAQPVPYFAIGTADVPTPVPPAGRFPPKDVRLTAIDISDGSPLWSWREQFSQDSFVQFDLTMSQYLNALAPNDYNGDGVRELLTPAQYVMPSGANQTLVAQSEHFYQTLDGMTGLPIHHIKSWGPTGVALTCKANDSGLTVFSGHSRRIDMTRFELGQGNRTVTQAFRYPLFNNPDFAAATQSTDIVSWGSKCILASDGRFAFSTNPELFSAKRGIEVKNVYGVVGGDNKLLWQIPPVEGKPPISLDAILRYFEIEEPSNALTLAFTAGPIAPGIVAGVGLSRLRARKGGI